MSIVSRLVTKKNKLITKAIAKKEVSSTVGGSFRFVRLISDSMFIRNTNYFSPDF